MRPTDGSSSDGCGSWRTEAEVRGDGVVGPPLQREVPAAEAIDDEPHGMEPTAAGRTAHIMSGASTTSIDAPLDRTGHPLASSTAASSVSAVRIV